MSYRSWSFFSCINYQTQIDRKMLVDLPLTPFSKRCITFEYGASPILVDSRTELFRNLSKNPFSNKITKAEKVCTEQVKIKIPKRLEVHFIKNGSLLLGYLLHSHYINKMLSAILNTTSLSSVTVMDALKNYFLVRNITEDDFALESAYKAWQRYQHNFIQKNKEISITKSGAVIFSRYTLESQFVLKKLLIYFEVSHKDLHSFPLPCQALYQIRKYIMFLLIQVSDATYREVGKIFKINYPAVWKNVERTKFYYDKCLDPTLNEEIDKAFDYLFDNSPLDKAMFKRLLIHEH